MLQAAAVVWLVALVVTSSAFGVVVLAQAVARLVRGRRPASGATRAAGVATPVRVPVQAGAPRAEQRSLV